MLFSSARLIRPGRTERVERVADELAPHRAEYEALNERFGVTAHAIWVNHLADGTDLMVNSYEIDPDALPTMLARPWRPDDSAYDRWWLDFVRDVIGVDMTAGSGLAAPPERVLEWTAEP